MLMSMQIIGGIDGRDSEESGGGKKETIQEVDSGWRFSPGDDISNVGWAWPTKTTLRRQ